MDSSRAYMLVEGFFCICNYPEANTTNLIYMNNVTLEMSSDNFPYGRIIGSAFPGNHTISNINCTYFASGNMREFACSSYILFPNCIPEDDLQILFQYSNMSFDGRFASGRGDFSFPAYSQSDLVHYRKYEYRFTNFTFTNYDHKSHYGLQLQLGLGSEINILTNYYFKNITDHLPILENRNLKSSILKNFTFADNPTLYNSMVTIYTNGDLSISDFNILNYKNDGSSVHKPTIDVIPGPYSIVTFSNFFLSNVTVADSRIFNFQYGLKLLTLNNFNFSDVQFNTGGTVFNFQEIGAFSITDFAFDKVRPINEPDSDSRIFNIRSLSIDKMTIGKIRNIFIRDSVFTLYGIESIFEFTDELRSLFISNFSFTDSTFPTIRTLITTDIFAGHTNLEVSMDSMKFENLNFASGGTLLSLYHQLPNTLNITNSSFKNIWSGNIYIGGSANPEKQRTQVLFKECQFEDILVPNNILFEITQTSIVEIQYNLFNNITCLEVLSGIFLMRSKSQLSISDTIFSSNSGIDSVLFSIDDSKLSCTNCTVANNFGLQNGLFAVESFGTISFFNSEIHDNFGVQNLLGSLFLGVNPSVFSNSSVYDNYFIPKVDILKEVTEGCTHLCFLTSQMKDYLAGNDLSFVAESEYLLEVVQASVDIIDQSQVYRQSLLLNSFSSTITIQNSSISDISFKAIPLSIVSSTLNMNDCTVDNATELITGSNLILVNSGTANLSKVEYTNSNTKFMIALNSDITLEDIALKSMAFSSEAISISYCNSFYLREFSLNNVSFAGKYIITFIKSNNIVAENITLTALTETFMNFKQSNVTRIHHLQITEGIQAFKFVLTNVQAISESVFSKNTGTGSGGTFSMENSKVRIYDSTFVNNTAVNGGAIEFHCTGTSSCLLDINSCHFENNTATVMGGAIHYDYNKPSVMNTSFVNNSAQYGENFASYANRIGLVNSSTNDDIINQEGISSLKFSIINDVGPGIKVEETLYFALLDMDGQVMNLDSLNTVILFPKNTSLSTIDGANVGLLRKGIAMFDNIIMEIDVNHRTANYSITSKAIDKARVADVLSDSFKQEDLIVNFRDCKPGERIINNACIECTAGTYSLFWNSTECHDCYLHADCLGGNQVSLKPGYWRRYQNSTKVVECIFRDACPGGYSKDTIVPTNCASGYTGNLCSECKITEDFKYERINDFECQKCPNPIFNSIKVVVVMLVVLSFFILMTIINVRKTTESQISVLLRILTNYLQLMIVSTSMSNQYPSTVITIFIPFKAFGGSTDAFLSFDCFLDQSQLKGPFGSNSVFKLFLLMFLPIILFIIVSLMWVVTYLIRKKWAPNMKRNLIITFITIVFILHPKIAERSINIFRCIEIDENTKVALIDTKIICYSYTHLKWCIIVALPILLIWVTACPLIALILMYKNKKKMGDYFLTIYQGLKPNVRYWEFVNTLRKVLILSSLLLTTTSSVFVALSILIVSSRLQIWLDPYKNPEHSKAEYMAMMGGVLTITASLLYSQNEQVAWMNVFILYAILLINLKFVLDWLYLVLKLYHAKNCAFEMAFKLLSRCLCKKYEIEKKKTKNKKKVEKFAKETPDRLEEVKKVLVFPKKKKRTKHKRNKMLKSVHNSPNLNENIMKASSNRDCDLTDHSFVKKKTSRRQRGLKNRLNL
ncbi:unnamed protein product [Moneuplotes crassus]|uniref:Uncharacterized protein n=1 Tax=Euplotes crassus TaxID=5936 RepID=A0AAD1X8B4_EUPCR|nr:unnamed protein product [Moneuplotes crassus]